MSENVLTFIPKSPVFVPTIEAKEDAISFLKEVLPKANDIDTRIFDTVRFIDQGENFEAVICPKCGSEFDQDLDWWQNAMDQGHDKGFENTLVEVPCCRKAIPLTDLKFRWPAGFARFSLSVRNPDISEFSPEFVARLEKILGCHIEQIWAHY